MFRGHQLLTRLGEIAQADSEKESHPIALLATENKTEAATLRPVLEKLKFRVMEAVEGKTALELALKFSTKLVVVAVHLPQFTGYQLYQRLREERGDEDITFVFITPFGELPAEWTRREIFASDYVQRPIVLEEFERRLKSVLRSGTDNNVQVLPSKDLRDASRAGVARELSSSLAEHRQDSVETPQSQMAARRVRESGLKGIRSGSRSKVSAQSPQVSGRPVHSGSAEVPETQVVTSPVKVKAPPITPPPVETRKGRQQTPVARELGERSLPTDSARVQKSAETAEEIFQEAMAFVLASIRHAEMGKPLDLQKGLEISRWIVSSVERERGLLLLATERASEFSLARSSVNVAIIAVRVAQVFGMAENGLLVVCLAGLLHDIGTIKLPKKFIYKPRAFTREERALIQQVPVYSSQILANIAGFEWLPKLVIQIHEREDGKGFPFGLQGKEIGDEARVLGISSLFEACIHRRPYREATTGYQAMEVITAEARAFSDRIAKAMIRGFSVYPFNEYVVLNTGEIGQVIDINPENPLRPAVKLLYSADGEQFYDHKVINLVQNSSIHIARSIALKDLPNASVPQSGLLNRDSSPSSEAADSDPGPSGSTPSNRKPKE